MIKNKKYFQIFKTITNINYLKKKRILPNFSTINELVHNIHEHK